MFPFEGQSCRSSKLHKAFFVETAKFVEYNEIAVAGCGIFQNPLTAIHLFLYNFGKRAKEFLFFEMPPALFFHIGFRFHFKL